MKSETVEDVLFPGVNLVVRQAVVADDTLVIDAAGCGPPGPCPQCQYPAARVHSRYWRHVAGLPVGGHRLIVRLRVRRFFCDQAHCQRRTFVEQVAGLTEPRRRKTGRQWPEAGRDLGLFMVWLNYTPAAVHGVVPVVQPGPGAAPVRGLLSYAVTAGEAPRGVLGQIYELADSRDLSAEATGEDGGLFYRLRPVHRLREPAAEVDRAADAELVAMFVACRSAWDRLVVLLLGRVGLRRSDVHLLPDSRALACEYPGAHVHVRRRENSNGVWSKSRHSWVAPLDFLTVSTFDLYYEERHRLQGDGGSD